jgi:hypothetical protein
MRAGPWSHIGPCIYEPPVGEGVARGDFFVDCFSEDAARKLVAVLNEQQRAIPERRVRSAPPPKKRTRERRSERVRDAEYLAWVRTQPCAYRAYDERIGNTLSYGLWHVCPKNTRIEAHHAGRRPMGRKCNDREAVPLCHESHDELTNLGWPKEQRRAFEAWAIKWTLARYAEQHHEVAA